MTEAVDADAMANGALQATIPVVWAMGVRFVDLGRPGEVSATVPLEGNTNHLGTMYAGVIFTVAEVLGGALALSTFDWTKYAPVLKDLQINYLKPVRSDLRASASLDAELVETLKKQADETGKAQFILTSEVKDADGVVVATTTGTYQLRAIAA